MTEISIGTTAFFRNRPLIDTLLNCLKSDAQKNYKVLFHADSIKKDLKRNGYRPVLENQELIHDSWLDRRVEIKGEVRTSQIFTDWRLPHFSKIEGYEYKYCSLFEKCD